MVSAESDRSIDEPIARLRVAQVVSGRLKMFDSKLLAGDPFPQIAFCADDSINLARYCVFGPIAVKQKPTASMETAGTPPVEAERTVSLRGRGDPDTEVDLPRVSRTLAFLFAFDLGPACKHGFAS